jgi:hypothetical protein
MEVMIVKMDLSKDFDKVGLLFLPLILIHLGFSLHFVAWVIGCVSLVSFVVLINGTTSPLFKPERGIRHGCPLSPLLFLLVAKGLSKSLKLTSANGSSFKDIMINNSCFVCHLLYIDNILIFFDVSRRMVDKLKEILDLFYVAPDIMINSSKSMIP